MVSVLTNQNDAVPMRQHRNYILRLLGRMRYHTCVPKHYGAQAHAAEVQHLERGQYRNSRCSRHRHKDIHLTEGGLELYGLQIEKSAEVILGTGTRAVKRGGGLTEY